MRYRTTPGSLKFIWGSEMLRVEGLDLYYGESHTLRDVCFAVQPSLCTCIMGRNGVGKTTLLRAIMGLDRVRTGQVSLAGNDISQLSTEQRSRLGIGYVPQGRQIFPLLTIEENLRTGLSARGLSKVPDLVYELFPVLWDMRQRRGGDLSGGQQQQLAIGRALAVEPELLILDEPTEGIQPNIVAEIADIIKRLRQAGLTILLVEQKLPFIRKLMDSFVLMDRGSVVATGDDSDLDENLVKRYLTV